MVKKFSKKDGKPFAIIKLEDFSGSVEAMIWNAEFTKYAKILEPGQVVSIGGRVKKRFDELSVVVSEIAPLRMPKPPVGSVRLQFDMEGLRPDELGELRDILAASPGESPVELEFRRADGHRLLMQAGPSHCVRLTPELRERLGARLSVR